MLWEEALRLLADLKEGAVAVAHLCHEVAQGQGRQVEAELSRRSEELERQLRSLVDTLAENSHLEPNLQNLCSRLNFNHFYTTEA